MITSKEYKPIYLTADIPKSARYWRNLPEVWRWCRQRTLLTEHEQQEWIEKIHYDPSIKMFGVYCSSKETKDYVGVCGLTSLDLQNSKAEFSLYISPEHQGRGYGQKALGLLLAHAFMDFGLRRIWGEVFEGNPAMKMFKGLGFQHEGTLRSSYWKNGRFIDSDIVSLLTEEWQRAQRKKMRVINNGNT